MAKSIFDILNDICYNKVRWEDQTDKKQIQPYMITRWLSMHREYLDIVSDVQPITSRLEPREFYIFYSDLLPKKKFFTKYIKAGKESDKSNKLIQFICEKKQVGMSDALDIIELSNTDELIDWIRGFGYSDADIKKQFGI